MIIRIAAAIAITGISVSATAQDTALPVQAVRVAPAPAVVLPAGTEIALKMTEEVTTKGKGWEEGDQFTLTTASDTLLGDYVVIPAGTKAVGRITWLTSRGAFGKSGKMDVEMEHLEMGGRRINLDGTFRQEGSGATLATVGGVLAAGVFAGFITGKSAVIPRGRELVASLESDLPVALPAGASLAPKAVQATAVSPVEAAAAEVGEAAAEAEAAVSGDKGNEPTATQRVETEIMISQAGKQAAKAD